MLCKETHDDVIRFAPPLVIEERDLDLAVSKVRKLFA
jgi:ornithine--oxo-acid transaminase